MRVLMNTRLSTLPTWLTLCCAALWTAFGLAQAQSTVGVDPVAKLFNAAPGQVITQVLNVYNPNPTTQKLRIVAYLSDMNIGETGESVYPEAGSLPESLAKWVSFSPSEFELGGQDTKPVRYTVTVPKDAAPGTHWVMLMLEAQDPTPVPGKTLASFRLRVSHTIYVNVQPVVQAGSILGIFEQQPKLKTDVYQLGVQYANTGNAVTGVKGRVEVRNDQGELAATLPLPTTVALPGHNVLLKTSWGGPVPKGQYSALVILDNGQAGSDIAGEYLINLLTDLVTPQAIPTSGAAPAGGKP